MAHLRNGTNLMPNYVYDSSCESIGCCLVFAVDGLCMKVCGECKGLKF
jgi:hypothetical protein